MTYDPDKHYRRSIRLCGYDYAQPGAYFVTICTYGRECILGRVESGMVSLSKYGHIVDRLWRALPGHFPAWFRNPLVFGLGPVPSRDQPSEQEALGLGGDVVERLAGEAIGLHEALDRLLEMARDLPKLEGEG